MITLDGSAPNGTVESNLTFDGSILNVSGRIIASGSTTTELVRITQTGTGHSFMVEDSTNPDNSKFIIDNNGNVSIGLNDSFPTTKLYVSAFNNTVGIETSVGITGTINPIAIKGYTYGDNTNTIIGLAGYANDGIVAYGVVGQVGDSETGFTTLGIGGRFGAYNANGTRYSVQLEDGTEGTNKVLVSQTTDGKANWSNTLTGLTSVATTTLNATQSTILGSTSTDLVSITQLGTGNAFVVKDAPNDTSNFVIDQNGNVVIGATATSYKLDVTGDTRLAGNIYGTNSNNTIMSDALIQAGLLFLSNNC